MDAFFKHAKNFVSRDAGQKALQCICFDGQRAIACDARVLVMLKDFPVKPHLRNPLTEEEPDLQYPNVDRVIPRQFAVEAEYPTGRYDKPGIKGLADKAKFALEIVKKEDVPAICLEFNREAIVLTAKNSEGIVMTAPIRASMPNVDRNIAIVLNANYLKKVLAFFKDQRDNCLTIRISASNSLLVLESENAYALICGIKEKPGGRYNAEA